jgi:CubicO group peptidase (beta-lactamase class C family)
MRFRPRSPTPLLLALALLAAPARASTLPADLDGFFSRLADHGFSGSVLVTRHGEILLRKGYGLADRKTGAPVEVDTAFDIGSITKQFTATAILRLEMEGRRKPEDSRPARGGGGPPQAGTTWRFGAWDPMKPFG